VRLQGRELERALMLKETMNAGGGLTVSPETQARIHEREAQAQQVPLGLPVTASSEWRPRVPVAWCRRGTARRLPRGCWR
jgi:hypothetical protein